MDTYEGLHLGKRFTSGKECFPCQVTLGDVIHRLESEKERLGDSFRAENYLYCMAEAEGPCRFGMYTRLHRIVLDSLDSFGEVGIASVTSADSYSVGGALNRRLQSRLRRCSYCTCFHLLLVHRSQVVLVVDHASECLESGEHPGHCAVLIQLQN